MKRLMEKWGLQTRLQLIIVFVVFAITGSTSAIISRHICNLIGIEKETVGYFYLPIRLIVVFPVYQVLLVLIGAIFGQFRFFWAFEKKILTKMGLGFMFK